jgi:hypothetical protein
LVSAEEEGEPPEDAEQRADAAASDLPQPCPVCRTGVLVVIRWPRPTIAQIMQLPLEQLRQYRLPFP